MNKLYLLYLLIFSIAVGFSQERLIKGVVTDGSNPMADVNVQLFNKDYSTTTDHNGRYEINASPGDILFFNYPGMKPVKILIEDVTRILNLGMFQELVQLNDVTVTEKRNRSQKEMEIQYANNPNIIKTLFGYLDKNSVSYNVRILQGKDILSGEYDLANILRGRFAGVTVSSNLGLGSGSILKTTSQLANNIGFEQASDIGFSGTSVFVRGRRAIFDVDGQLFTDFPDFVDVQNIERIGIITSFAGTVRYGSIANGGGSGHQHKDGRRFAQGQ